MSRRPLLRSEDRVSASGSRGGGSGPGLLNSRGNVPVSRPLVGSQAAKRPRQSRGLLDRMPAGTETSHKPVGAEPSNLGRPQAIAPDGGISTSGNSTRRKPPTESRPLSHNSAVDVNMRTDRVSSRPLPFDDRSADEILREMDDANAYGGQLESNSEDLVPVSSINPLFRSVFPYASLNPVQSKCFEKVYRGDSNCVVAAPTGCGKTAILELAIVRTIEGQLAASSASLESRHVGAVKMVYMAPIRALAQEKHSEWTEKLGPLGITVVELTGDTDLAEHNFCANADIIVTTPEKWDSVTRKWTDNEGLVGSVGLLLIDEVHLLNENRGPTLEAVVSRMKTVRRAMKIKKKPSGNIRFIAVSATIPNARDIGNWLESDDGSVLTFGPEYRPVRLQQYTLGYWKKEGQSDFLFDRNLNYKVFDVVRKYSHGRPALVFCSTRKGTQDCINQVRADMMGRAPNMFVTSPAQRSRIRDCARNVDDRDLADAMSQGVAWHHAGLSRKDRNAVEGLFLTGDLLVICTTSTLAQGVNFPAHLVVVKGTKHYGGGMMTDYSTIEMQQMIGRAGRPQYDTEGVAVVMTDEKEAFKYERMGQNTVESHLHKSLIEHLNAEIVLGTVADISLALEWVKSSFLYVRMQQNPSYYGVPENTAVDVHVKGLLQKALEGLATMDMIAFDDVGYSVSSCDFGRVLAHMYVCFDSVKEFQSIQPQWTSKELLSVLATARENGDISLRTAEKRVLNVYNKDADRMRFPEKGRIKTPLLKITCLLQAHMGGIPIDDFGLRSELQVIVTNCARVGRALREYLVLKQWYTPLYHSLLLSKCMERGMWEISPFFSRQIDGVGKAYSEKLVAGGLTSFQALHQCDPRRIETLLGKRPPFGNEFKAKLEKLVRYTMNVTQKRLGQHSKIEVTVRIAPVSDDVDSDTRPHANQRGKRDDVYYLLAGTNDHRLVFWRRLLPRDVRGGTFFSFVVSASDAASDVQINRLVVRLVSEHYVGLDSVQKLSLDFPSRPGKRGRQLTIPAAQSASGRSSSVQVSQADLDLQRRIDELSATANIPTADSVPASTAMNIADDGDFDVHSSQRDQKKAKTAKGKKAKAPAGANADSTLSELHKKLQDSEYSNQFGERMPRLSSNTVQSRGPSNQRSNTSRSVVSVPISGGQPGPVFRGAYGARGTAGANTITGTAGVTAHPTQQPAGKGLPAPARSGHGSMSTARGNDDLFLGDDDGFDAALSAIELAGGGAGTDSTRKGDGRMQTELDILEVLNAPSQPAVSRPRNSYIHRAYAHPFYKNPAPQATPASNAVTVVSTARSSAASGPPATSNLSRVTGVTASSQLPHKSAGNASGFSANPNVGPEPQGHVPNDSHSCHNPSTHFNVPSQGSSWQDPFLELGSMATTFHPHAQNVPIAASVLPTAVGSASRSTVTPARMTTSAPNVTSRFFDDSGRDGHNVNASAAHVQQGNWYASTPAQSVPYDQHAGQVHATDPPTIAATSAPNQDDVRSSAFDDLFDFSAQW